MDQVAGSLIGTAIGDSLGLSREGLSKRRAQRLFGSNPKQSFFFGRGMLSDDTAHAELTLAAYRRANGDLSTFHKQMRSELRLWFLTLPPGIGLATLRSCLRLTLGLGNPGVNSAGNGPAMRAPMLGALILDMTELLEWVDVSTLLTHTHPVAVEGARLAAQLANSAASGQLKPALVNDLFIDNDPWRQPLNELRISLERGESTGEYLSRIGLSEGVSGYMLHTMCAATFICLRHEGDFRICVTEAVTSGGDSDTLGAIVGGICGAAGLSSIPPEMQVRILDWPSTTRLIAEATQADAAPYWKRNPHPVMIGRNALLLAVVLGHMVRRCLPPY